MSMSASLYLSAVLSVSVAVSLSLSVCLPSVFVHLSVCLSASRFIKNKIKLFVVVSVATLLRL